MAKILLLNTPTRLYRHRPLDTSEKFEREIEAIARRQLHFAVFEKLNDPMEGLSRRSLGFRQKDVAKKTYNRILNSKEKVGICSLSETSNSELMWAHYSANYSGICIGYRTEALLSGLDNSVSLIRIQYADRSPLLTMLDAQKITTAVRKILSFKNARWQYEREWRLLSGKPGLFRIGDSNCVTSIYMGSRIKRSHRATIEKLVSKTSIRLFLMKVSDYEHIWEEL